MGYALSIAREAWDGPFRPSNRAAIAPCRAAHLVQPELRSTLFLVPGLIAYIAMITAVVSTALSIVREKERGRWSRCGWRRLARCRS